MCTNATVLPQSYQQPTPTSRWCGEASAEHARIYTTRLLKVFEASRMQLTTGFF